MGRLVEDDIMTKDDGGCSSLSSRWKQNSLFCPVEPSYKINISPLETDDTVTLKYMAVFFFMFWLLKSINLVQQPQK